MIELFQGAPSSSVAVLGPWQIGVTQSLASDKLSHPKRSFAASEETVDRLETRKN